MRSKLIIIFILLLTIFFYFYRISIEIKSKSVSLIMNYRSFLNYYCDENKDVEVFVDKLIKYKVYNIYIYPSDITDMVNEYNEVILVTGMKMNMIFNTDRFRRDFCYLVIPGELKNIIHEIAKFKQKFSYKDYLIYEFSDNRSAVKRFYVNYKYKFEDILSSRNIQIIKLQNRPFLKNIDSFLTIKKDKKHYLSDIPDEYNKIIKIHRFNKRLFKKEDIQIFVNENCRAILERNVKGVLLNTLYQDDRIAKLNDFLPELVRKVEKKGYTITLLKYTNFKLDNWDLIISLYKIIIFWLTILLLYFLFPVYKDHKKYKRFLIFIIFPLIFIQIVFSISVISLYHTILIFLFFYYINDFILRLNKRGTYSIQNLLLLIGSIFLSGICISNFLFNYGSFWGPSEITGVKISFLLPFVMWVIQYIRFNRYKFKEILQIKIDLLHFIILNTAIFLIAFLLLRSGNYYLTISPLELKLRQVLEDVFFIRPRFKELIFYAFLLLLFLGQNIRIIKNNLFLVYFLALIAISTTINSFLHIHTLSYYTILRSSIGMGIGFIIGTLIYLFIKKINKREEKKAAGVSKKP